MIKRKECLDFVSTLFPAHTAVKAEPTLTLIVHVYKP